MQNQSELRRLIYDGVKKGNDKGSIPRAAEQVGLTEAEIEVVRYLAEDDRARHYETAMSKLRLKRVRV